MRAEFLADPLVWLHQTREKRVGGSVLFRADVQRIYVHVQELGAYNSQVTLATSN